jgi:hypothetical protein
MVFAEPTVAEEITIVPVEATLVNAVQMVEESLELIVAEHIFMLVIPAWVIPAEMLLL